MSEDTELSTDVADHDPNHAGLHNDEREQINWLTEFLAGDGLSASIEQTTSPRAKARARAQVVRSVSFWGDSNTANPGAEGASFKRYIPALCRGRITPTTNLATGGYDTQDWLTAYTSTFLAMPDVLLPGRASIMLGTNDVGEASRPYVLANSRERLKDIYDLAESRSVLPIACTILPRPSTPGARVPAFNDMVQTIAADRGYDVADYYSAVNDSGVINASYCDGGDPVHLNAAGHEAVALAVFPTYRDSAPLGLIQTAGHVLEDINLDNNGLFASGGGSLNGSGDGGYPFGWFVNQNAPGSWVDDTSADGRWFRFKAESDSVGALHQRFFVAAVPGHRFALSMLVRPSAITTTAGGKAAINTEFRQGFGTTLTPINQNQGGLEITRNLGGRVLHYYYEATAPANTDYIVTNVTMTKLAANLDGAEIRVTDLTALGLA